MYIREFKDDQYDRVCRELRHRARPEPYTASFTVELQADGAEYSKTTSKITFLKRLRMRTGPPNGGLFVLIVVNTHQKCVQQAQPAASKRRPF